MSSADRSRSPDRRKVAVVGSGISGLSAAWLLSQRHDVTVFEVNARAGGHSNTIDATTGRPALADAARPVDTGFIVYNELTYPNLTAMFRHLGVPTKDSDMSFAVSLNDGACEYNGNNLNGLFAQRSNLLSLRFWSMLRDLLRFYRSAPLAVARLGLTSLDDFLDAEGYGRAFRDDHLYPMAGAIWSIPSASVGRYPAASFIRFCDNHGLLKISDRPIWRTVDGGAREYVSRMLAAIGPDVRLGHAARGVIRTETGVEIADGDGVRERFDDVVLACHADDALRLVAAPSAAETRLLGAFGYSENRAILHSDTKLMPRRRSVWSAWNYFSAQPRAAGDRERLCVTYWMNRLQGIDERTPLFVTLNPIREPRADLVIREETYHHPMFDAEAIRAQKSLWSLQGQGGVWYAGAYFGSGFHEDGLQAGLAVAEALGGVRRPWTVADESGRIVLPSSAEAVAA